MKTHFLVVVSCCLAGAFAKTICEEHRERELLSDSTVKFVPECTPDGDYAALQCFTAYSVEHCMCYTPEGRQVYGPLPTFSTCACLLHRDKELLLEESGSSSGFVPTCNEDGTYTKKQCNRLKDVCWCSDKEGNRISEEEKKGKITC